MNCGFFIVHFHSLSLCSKSAYRVGMCVKYPCSCVASFPFPSHHYIPAATSTRIPGLSILRLLRPSFHKGRKKKKQTRTSEHPTCQQTMPNKKQHKSALVLYAAAVLLLCLAGVFALLWWRRNSRLACRPQHSSPHSHHAPNKEKYGKEE